jgi:hypothetical protein
MAFKGTSISATSTTPATHTFPETTVVIGFLVSNTIDDIITVDVKVRDKFLVKNTVIPRGSSLVALQGKLVMMTGETAQVIIKNTGGAADAHISTLDEV